MLEKLKARAKGDPLEFFYFAFILIIIITALIGYTYSSRRLAKAETACLNAGYPRLFQSAAREFYCLRTGAHGEEIIFPLDSLLE